MTSTHYAIDHATRSLPGGGESGPDAGRAGSLAHATSLQAPRTHAADAAHPVGDTARGPGDGMRQAAGIAVRDPLRNTGQARSSAAEGGDAGKLYVLSLQAELKEWVDYRAVAAHANSPGAILRAVLAHHGQDVPDTEPVDLARLADDGWVDEAALLYHQAQDGGASRDAAPPALSQLRARFLDVLGSEDARWLATHRLLAQPRDPASKAPYFDGFGLRNAFGKSFDELLQMPELSSDPAFRTMATGQKQQLLRARLAAMGESADYRVGTPEHSMASVVIRMSKYMGVPPPAGLQDRAALAGHFKRLEDAWHARRETFPIHPRLYYAMHLARSSGVEVLSTAQLEERYNAVMRMAIERAQRGGDPDPQTWLQSLPAKWNAEGRPWNSRSEDVKRQALLAAFDGLREMRERRERPPGVSAERIWSFAEEVGKAGLLGKILVGNGSKEMAAEVLEYGQQRMRTAAGGPPHADLAHVSLNGLHDRGPEQALLGGSPLPPGGERLADGAAAPIPVRQLPRRQMQGALDSHAITKRLAIGASEIAGHVAIDRIVETPHVHVPDDNVPEDLRGLATRVRNGEAGVTWRGHAVVLLADENRVVPLKEAGGKFHELDWRTGQRVRSGRLIHRDPASGQYRAGSQLLGGGESLLDSAGKPVQKRVTVTDVHTALDRAGDASQGDFAAIFDRHFGVHDSGNGMLEWESAGRTGPQGVKDFLAGLYQRSHTFRRILNHYTAEARAPNHWKLNFGGSLRNPQPNEAKIFWDLRAVDLPANVQSLGEHRFYMSAEPAGMTVKSKENMLLYQLLGVLTEVREPTLELTWSQARTHPGLVTDTGAQSYLTDKVMSEAGYHVQERVSVDNLPGGSQNPLWKDAVHDAQTQSRYLDEFVDRGRPPVTADTLVQGGRVADRLTVRQWHGIEGRLTRPAAPGGTASARPDAWQTLQARFNFNAEGGADGRAMKILKRVSQRLAEKSEIFRTLLANMPPRQAGKWQFEFNAESAAELPADPTRPPLARQASGGANALNGKVYLFDDHTSYLSEEGLKPVEYERRVVQGLVNTMLELPMPAGEASANRGAAIRLSDMILAEAGYRLPAQLLAYRVPDIPAQQADLLSRLTSARRSKSVEDAFLEPHL